LKNLIDSEVKEARTANRVDGLIGFFTDEVRLSHHVAYGSRTTRFVKHTAIALYTDRSFVLLWDKASHIKVKPPYRISNNLKFSPSLDREASESFHRLVLPTTMASADFSYTNPWHRDLPR
jgi:hypothetical protein